MRKTDNSTHQTIMYFRLLCSKRLIQFPPISLSVITMSKSERFENMQGRILPNFDESTSRILVDDELIAAFLYINSFVKRTRFTGQLHGATSSTPRYVMLYTHLPTSAAPQFSPT